MHESYNPQRCRQLLCMASDIGYHRTITLTFRGKNLITDHTPSNIHPAGKLIIDYKQRAIDWRTLGTSRTEEMV